MYAILFLKERDRFGLIHNSCFFLFIRKSETYPPQNFKDHRIGAETELNASPSSKLPFGNYEVHCEADTLPTLTATA